MVNKLLKKSLLLFASALTVMSCGHGKTDEAARTSDTLVAVAEGVATLHLDSVSVTWIKDNAGDKLMPCSLFADAPDSIIDRLSLQGGVPSTVSVFLVESGGRRILFDTGLGLPDSRMTEGLKTLGLSPSDIDCICLTHFHGDHIGGLMHDTVPVFANAEVYASRVERDAWMAMPDDANAQLKATLAAYGDRVNFFEFGDTIAGMAVSLDAVGHTPGHTAYRVGRLLVVGDLMHGVALQQPYPDYCADYDMDKPKAVETRKRVMRLAGDEGLVMAGMHFPAPAFIMDK